MNNPDTPFDGWVPIAVEWRDGRPEIDWCRFGPERFREPFFEDTLKRVVSRPFNQAFRRRTGVEALETWAERRPGLTPNGFIFHMSRCGSTLVAQMLAARSDSVVVSEAAPLDAMLRPQVSGGAIREDDQVRWLRALLSALGHPRAGGERHFFIKLDCWHILSLPLIRRAFPSVPWIFLYREPREVLASHLRQRGVQTVPGLVDSRLFGIDRAAAATMPPPEYCTRVLGAICGAAVRYAGEAGGRLVNYRQLPDALVGTILPHFGVPAAASDSAVMKDAAATHSKMLGHRYSPADEAKPIPADGPAGAAVATYLDVPYRALEQLRVSQLNAA
jgi:hypothetical protein